MAPVHVLAAEVAGEAIAGVVGFVTLVIVGISSWALVLLVKMSQLLARIEERTEDLARRLADLERHRD